MSNHDIELDLLEWQPVATTEHILARSGLLEKIRSFFKDHEVVEVETPLLSRNTAIDPCLSSFETRDSTVTWYLQTSPEFHMKRLLAAGSGSIFQICKAFRRGESGVFHNPEFSMLEWYRVGFDHFALMKEVEELIGGILGSDEFKKISYRRLFEQFFNDNPHQVSVKNLVELVTDNVDIDETQLSFESEAMTRSFCLDLLMREKLESGLKEPTFIYDFPVCQAALSDAGVNSEGDLVAHRFELYIQQMEIANGYLELTDADELHDRFMADNTSRRLAQLPLIPVDHRLLSAMKHGLPDCAGVAVGIDRLLMLLTGTGSIGEILTFPGSFA